MKQQKKFESEEQSSLSGAEEHTMQNAAQEFSTVEELLRFDAAQTPVPSGIVERLQKSSADLPKPNRPWWQKLFQR
ncbi:MAG TPA: hypothetical protein VG938_01565 [Verrucomicrobiae bacterium]|jgi:hypothetical protein|nr:hypothetical protein [Verrucomicrobiae bacterium]